VAGYLVGAGGTGARRHGGVLMAKDLKKGDQVVWNTPQGETTGEVE